MPFAVCGASCLFLCAPCAVGTAQTVAGQSMGALQLGLPVGLVVGTIGATVLMQWKGWSIPMYFLAAIGQCAPCAALVASCDVAVMHPVAFFAASLGFLLLGIQKLSLRWVLCAVAVQGLCVAGASVLLGTGLVLQCRHAASPFGLADLLRISNDAIPYALMGALCLMQHGRTELQEASLQPNQEARDCVLQVVSHEMRGPLHVIAGHADSLAKTTGTVGECGQEIAAHCSNLLIKVTMMTDFMQTQRGCVQPARTRFPVRRLLSNAVTSLTPQVAAKALELLVLPAADSPHYIVGDEARTLQALHCLLDNAVKYSTTAGVVRLRLSKAAGAAVCFTVEDSGVGMDAQTLRTATAPFARAARAPVNTQPSGLGLGLSVANHWAARLEGTLSLTSAGLGQGSTAVLVVPTNLPSPQPLLSELQGTAGCKFQLRGSGGCEAAAMQLLWLGLQELERDSRSSRFDAGGGAARSSVCARSDDTTVASGASRPCWLRLVQDGGIVQPWGKVPLPVTPAGLLELIQNNAEEAAWPRSITRALIVDDGPSNRRLMRLKLESWSTFRCDEAENGAEAVDRVVAAAATELPYDVILMDIDMPVMDGMEATRRIRGRRISTPIFAITANAVQSVADDCSEAGMNRVFTKPVDWASLREAVRHVLLANAPGLAEYPDYAGSRDSLAPLLPQQHSDVFDPGFHSSIFASRQDLSGAPDFHSYGMGSRMPGSISGTWRACSPSRQDLSFALAPAPTSHSFASRQDLSLAFAPAPTSHSFASRQDLSLALAPAPTSHSFASRQDPSLALAPAPTSPSNMMGIVAGASSPAPPRISQSSPDFHGIGMPGSVPGTWPARSPTQAGLHRLLRANTFGSNGSN